MHLAPSLALMLAMPLAMSLDSAQAAPTHAVLEQSEWDNAVALRTKLEADPAQQRTREQFEAVLNAFRLIYHQNPTAAKAPAAVAAVADLLAEKGRVLGDQKALRAAIGQYDFLRQQYPQSPQVDNALLLEGEICRQDLKDTACAQEKLRAVVAGQPGSSFAEQAAIELKDLDAGNAPAAGQQSPDQAAQTSARTRTSAAAQAIRSATKIPSPPPDPPPPGSPPPGFNASLPAAQATAAAIGGTRGHVVMITGMRHWSNPTSTRIAIDLGGKVEYEAARVPNPDRIFFDLHGARLAAGLNGHQVEVIDDGYLKRIRAAQFHPDVTRVVLDVSDVTEYSAFLLPNPWRLIIDIHSDKTPGKSAVANKSPATSPPALAPVTRANNPDSTIADVAGLSSEPARVPATDGPTSDPVSAQVPAQRTTSATKALPAAATDSHDSSETSAAPNAKGRKRGRKVVPVAAPAEPDTAVLPHPADPTADGQRSLVRALGLKVGRIVIDAGHGGHDSGTLGPGGIEEKDVVLDVALRTGKLLHQRLGAEIVYTRDDDTFIPLETRTAIANKAEADLFLSIHGNSSPDSSARGVETYYLNFTSDPNALEVAARENAVSNHSVHQLSDLVRKITLKDKIDESREFAADVDAGLYAGLKSGNPGLRDRGAKTAPFVVLIGAQMPSVLAEISFLTNPDDADQLSQASYRQRIAEALDAGVERYLHGLSGLRPAEKAKSSAKNLAKSGEVEPAGQ